MRARFLMMFAVSVFAAVAAFVVHLTLRFENVQLGYAVGSERKRERGLIEQRRLLMLEAATLRQVERVETVARGSLGMDLAPPSRVISVGGAHRSRVSGRVE